MRTLDCVPLGSKHSQARPCTWTIASIGCFFGVSVQVRRRCWWQPGSLGEQLVENGEEILAQCLANVCRQEWMVAKVVAPPGGGHLLGEQPMTFPA